jgi:hypothetical protein
MRCRWAACLVAVLAAGCPCLVTAQPERAEATLRYDLGPGAEVCPRAGDLEAAVAARLGYFPFRAGSSRAVVVRIERASRGLGLRADVELRDAFGHPSGRRELTTPSDDCHELIASVAVAISLGLDPLGLGRPSSSGSVGASPSASTATPVPPAPPAVSAPPGGAIALPAPSKPEPALAPSSSTPPVGATSPPRPGPAPVVPWQLRASLGSQLWSGAGPEIALGWLAGVSVRRAAFSAALEGRADLRSTVRDGGTSADSSITTVGLAPCVHRGRVVGCVLAQLGSIVAEAHGIDQPRRDRSLYSALGARAGLELGLGGGLFLRPHLDLLVPLRRSTFFVDGRPLWTSPPVSGSAGLDLGIDFL